MNTEQRLLWKEAFGDTDAFVDLFAQTAYSPDRCHTLTAEGRLAAALYWFDCEIAGDKAAYLYAVATATAFRGRGYCKRLMDETHALLRRRGYASALLVPGTPPLAAMYEKMGYAVATTAETETVTAGRALPLRTVDAEQYAIRRRQLLPLGGTVQEGENLRFLAAYHALYEGDDLLVAAYREGETLIITELLGEPTAASGVVAALGCRVGKVRLPAGDKPYAMWRPLNDAAVCPTYFGLAFE